MQSGARRWADLAWPDLGAAVAPTDGHAVGLVPVGATEQHGPHLPSGTDTLVAQAICDEASARTGCLVLPALPVGVSYGHGTELPGTLCLTPELMAAVIKQYALWAAMSGLRRLLFVNAHLGNTSTIGIATDVLRLHHPELRVGAIDWWACSAEISGRGHRGRRRHPRQPSRNSAGHGDRTRSGTGRPHRRRRRRGPHRRAGLPLHRAGTVHQRSHRQAVPGHRESSATTCSTWSPPRSRPASSAAGSRSHHCASRPYRPTSPSYQEVCCMDTVKHITDDNKRWAASCTPTESATSPARWIDVMGRAKSKMVPIDHLPNLLAGSERYTPRGMGGLGAMTRTRTRSSRCPTWPPCRCCRGTGGSPGWRPTCRGEGAEPWALCPRSILRSSCIWLPTGVSVQPRRRDGVLRLPGGDDVTAPVVPMARSRAIAARRPAYDLEVDHGRHAFPRPHGLVRCRSLASASLLRPRGRRRALEFDFNYADALGHGRPHHAVPAGWPADRQAVRLTVTFMPKPTTRPAGAGATTST